MSKAKQKSPGRRLSRDLDLVRGLWSEPIDRVILPNGLTLITKRDDSAPLVSVQVWIRTGSIHEGRLLGSGVSHFLEHMLFKGTPRRQGREISSLVQAHGGYINAYTTFDRTVYYVEMPAEHLGVGMDVLADSVLHSTLPEAEVTKEREVILREIAMVEDDPDQRVAQALFDTAFRQHPYRYPIIGYKDVFETLGRAELEGYYRERYVPNNMVLVVVGDVEPAAVQELAEAHFGPARRSRLAPVYFPDEGWALAGRERHVREDVSIARAAMGFQIPGLAHADTPLLSLLASLLGYGESSILWQEIREQRRLVHSIDAHAWNPGSCGLFYISFTSDPERREEAVAAVRAELDRCARRTFPARLLAKAIRQAVAGEINARKTVGGQAARLGTGEVVVGDLNYSEAYFRRLCSATPADLRRVAQTYLVPEHLTLVSSSPDSAAARPAAAPRRPAYSLDFSEVAAPNASRLLLQPNRKLPNVHLRLVCLGGPLYEPARRRGATNLMATLLTKDTRRRTAEEVAQTIEEAGGSFYEFCGNNSFGLAVEVLPDDIGLGLDLLRDAVLYPAFDAETLATEKEAHIAGLKEEDDDIVTFGAKLLRRRFFGTHPFAVGSGGTVEGIQSVTASDLQALRERLLVAGNVILAVAGDFSPKGLTPKLKSFLSRLGAGRPAASRAAFEAPSAGEHLHKLPRQQAVVFEAYPGPGLRQPDFYTSELMDELFSGMSSRLFERVREEKSLAYFVRSSRVIGLKTGMFFLMAGTAPDRQREVFAEFDREIRRVQAGRFQPEELARCRARLKAGRRMSMQTNSARAMQAALNAAYDLPVNDWKNYDAYIDAVTPKDLAAFARRNFIPEQRLRLVVGP